MQKAGPQSDAPLFAFLSVSPVLWPPRPYVIFPYIYQTFTNHEKGPSRMIRLLAAASILVLFSAATPVGQTGGGQSFKSFQLLYHSDTRGYYRPCG
jgi:hypothetical protein